MSIDGGGGPHGTTDDFKLMLSADVNSPALNMFEDCRM
jgi:hypothetical protein